jgi:hypothetical protein
MEKSRTARELPKLAANKGIRTERAKPYGARVTVSIPNFRGIMNTKVEEDIANVLAASSKSKKKKGRLSSLPIAQPLATQTMHTRSAKKILLKPLGAESTKSLHSTARGELFR